MNKTFLSALIIYAIALPLSMAAANFALFLLVALTALFFFRNARATKNAWGLSPKKSFIIILLFFLWVVISYLIVERELSMTVFHLLKKCWNFLPYLLIPLLFHVTKEDGDIIEKVIKVLMIFASAVVILGAVQYFGSIHYFFENWFNAGSLVVGKRFQGFQSHPLHSGALYSILFLVAFNIAFSYSSYPPGALIDSHEIVSHSGSKIFWIIISVILGLGVVLTGSRSYYIAMAVVLLFLLAKRGWKFFAAGLAVGALIIFAITRFELDLKSRLYVIQFGQMDKAGTERIYAWKSALKMIKDHPLTGVGYQKWGEKLPDYAKFFPDWNLDKDSSALAHAHNSYLTVASETGLIGLALFLLFWLFVLKEQLCILSASKKNTFSYALALGTASSVFALLIAAFFEHNLLTATVCLALFFVIGLSRAASFAASY